MKVNEMYFESFYLILCVKINLGVCDVLGRCDILDMILNESQCS